MEQDPDPRPGNTDVSKVSGPASPGRGSRALQKSGCGLPRAPVPMRPASRGLESCRATPSRSRDPPAHPPQLPDLLGKSLSEWAAEGLRPLQRRAPCLSPPIPWLALLADGQGNHVYSWPGGPAMWAPELQRPCFLCVSAAPAWASWQAARGSWHDILGTPAEPQGLIGTFNYWPGCRHQTPRPDMRGQL